jgi:3-hydroxyisobutyrate dehydrogenase-like beta-hydroxyacid dehydrogenase
MSDVTVIGLGAMGSALAATLIEKGHAVTVWNRTATRAAPLVAAGADQAATPRDAVAASPVTIVCVGGYADTREVLDTTAEALAGKVLVQLTTGTGTQADELGEWARATGADYLDGVILGYPSQIGSAEVPVLAAGQPSAWERSSSLLLDLGGASAYLGENLRSPAALDSALVTSMAAMALGAIHGALLCESEDFPVPVFAEIVQQTLPTAAGSINELLSSIAENRFEHPEAALKTYAAPIAAWANERRQRGLNAEFLEFLDGVLSKSIASGHGDEELSAVIKVWRNHH